jgi:formylmethanofuran dehydrogenase subunit E
VSVGHRSLKIEDYGKIAATFVDVRSGEAVRVHLIPGVRELARRACPEATRAYFAQLRAYQIIPDRELLNAQWVTLNQDIRLIRGTPRQRSNCIQCGEEIINGREVMKNEMIICVACAGNAYYHLKEAESAVEEKPEQANDFLDLVKPGIKACQPDNPTHA